MNTDHPPSKCFSICEDVLQHAGKHDTAFANTCTSMRDRILHHDRFDFVGCRLPLRDYIQGRMDACHYRALACGVELNTSQWSPLLDAGPQRDRWC